MRKHTVRPAVEALETRLALNGTTPVPVLTTRAYHQAADKIEDAADDAADDFADAFEDFFEGGFDEGENLEDFFDARLELLQDLDKVSRKIPFGRRGAAADVPGHGGRGPGEHRGRHRCRRRTTWSSCSSGNSSPT